MPPSSPHCDEPLVSKLIRLLRWNVHRMNVAYTLVVLFGVVFLGWHLLIPGLISVVGLLLVLDGIARPGSSLFHSVIVHGPRGTHQVALTFDDGPDPKVTPQVLDELRRAGVRATFFIVGKNLEAQPELGRRIVAEGHVLANHSWEHSYLQSFYMPKRHTQELLRCEQAIEAITGQPSSGLYRPPVGLKSGELAHAIWDTGLTLVAWSVHSHDTVDPQAQRIARRVLARIKGGDIVLLHDGDRTPGRRSACAEAVRLILAGLRERGLECVTLPELLGISPRSVPEPLPARPEALT
jgi:peptidoglycan/xylan/chitin deacetylase (PgdA/CDA1 family)